MIPLTPRQRTIVEMVGEGRTYVQIAKRLKISKHTVRTHARLVYARLDTELPLRSALVELYWTKLKG